MVNPTYEKLGSAPSMIRELFAYGLRRSAEVGPENVFDYSLGNPSIPAPQPVQQALLDVLHDTDPIQVHGYSMAGGFDGTRRAVAEDLTHRFGMTIRPEELFFTCGAAAAEILGRGLSIVAAAAAETEADLGDGDQRHAVRRGDRFAHDIVGVHHLLDLLHRLHHHAL